MTRAAGWKDFAASPQLMKAVTEPQVKLQSSTDEVKGATKWLEGSLKELGLNAKNPGVEVRYFPKTKSAEMDFSFFSGKLDSWVRHSVKGVDLRDGKVSFNVAETKQAVLDAYATRMMSRALDSVPGARQALTLKSDFSGLSGSLPDLGVRLSFASNATNATAETVVPLTRHGRVVPEDRLFASMQEAIQQAMAKTGKGWGPGTAVKAGP